MSDKKKDIIEAQLKVYRDNFIKHGDSPLGTRQNNRETQFLRFERLVKNVEFTRDEKISIHDIGSGLCDMNEFLEAKQLNCTYSGTEIVQEMIDVAQKKFPTIELFNRDILKEEIKDTYDYVVSSGMFNMPGNVPEEDWKNFVFSIIKKMFSMCTKAISFNLLTTHKTFTDPSLFYLSPEEVLSMCMKELSRFVTIDHSYALYEYTVTVHKKEHLKTTYESDFFSKYFK
jgi:cyclopropane fatty-acyl-phospholipid synthase-like methyltransferase